LPTQKGYSPENSHCEKNADDDGASSSGRPRLFALRPLNFVKLHLRFGRQTAMGPYLDKGAVCRFVILSPGLLPSGLIRCPCAITGVGVRIIIAAVLCAQNVDHVWLVIAAQGTRDGSVATL